MRMIDADALKENIRSWLWQNMDLYEQLLAKVDDMPTVERWIPYNDIKPDIAGMPVLLTVKQNGQYGKRKVIQAFTGYGNPKIPFYTNLAGNDFRELEVIAWMPLPEPYTEVNK